MASLVHDLTFALRQLRAQPGFAAAAVLSLGLGVGLNVAVFSVVDGVLLRRSPVEDIERVVLVWETDRGSGTTREPASWPDYQDFRDRSSRVATLAAVMAAERNLTPPSGEPVRLGALQVSSSFLPLVGVAPLAGRGFGAADEQPGAPAVVLISESLWRRVFDGRPDVAGQVLRLDDVPHEVVGVVPDAADFGMLQVLGAAAYARGFADRGIRVRVDVWTPLRATADELPRSTHPIFVLGRLAPGATTAEAQDELAAIAADLERDYPENAGRGVFVEPLDAVVFGPVRPGLLVLWAAVGLVLLVACVNLANLLLARGVSRAREFAVRLSLGSSAGRLARQLVVETLVLTTIGTLVGVALASGLLRAIVAQAPAGLPRLEGIAIDLRVLGVAALVALVSGLIAGLVPAWQALAIRPQSALAGDGAGRGSTGHRAHRARAGLVVAEMALAVVLVTGAALLIQTLWHIQRIDPGFAAAGVLKAEYQLPASRYPVDFERWPNLTEQHAFTRELLARAEALPGVSAAAIAGNHPLDPGFTNSFSIVGREDERYPEISVRRVSPGYFETVGLRLAGGRLLQESDTTDGAPVALINERARSQLFGDRDPVGAQIAFWGTRRTIVGVARDERFQGVTEPSPIAVYVPLSQAPSTTGTGVLLLRTTQDPRSLASSAVRAVREVDAQLAVFGVEPLSDTFARSIAEQRFVMRLLAFFAAMALVLAGVGVYGVLSYSVARRARELGIRLALGADPASLRRAVIGEGLRLGAIGLLIGLGAAYAATRALTSLLYGVAPADPLTFGIVAAALMGVALASALLPARRATAVDPATAMRVEA